MRAATLRLTPDDAPHPDLNSFGGFARLTPLPPRRDAARHWTWGPAVATAVLVLLVLIGSFVAFDGSLRRYGNEVPAFLPAPVATPGTATAAGAPLMIEQTWETKGGPSSPLDGPFGMAIAPDGALWVSDSNNNRFQVFAPDGTFLEMWGTAGSGDGQFNFRASDSADKGTPGGYGDIAFAPDGTFYVADTGNFRIQKFGPDRSFLGAWGSEGVADGQFRNVISVAVGPDGSVYTADENRDDVQRFDADGEFLNTIGGADASDDRLTYPVAVTVDAEGTVWVANFSQPSDIARFSPDGEPLGLWEHDTRKGTLRAPLDLAIDGEGRVWVTDLFRVQVLVYAPDGSHLATLRHQPSEVRQGGFFDPAGIAVNEDGQVFVGDWFGDFVTAFQVGPTAPAN